MAETKAFDHTAIREWLQEAVKNSGLSPGGLAKKAGISPTTLTRFVYGRATHLPTFRTLRKVAAAAGVAPITGWPDWEETEQEAPKDPVGALFNSLMDITHTIQGVQKDAMTGALAHPEIEEFRSILQELAQVQDRLRGLVREEVAKISEASAAALRKRIVAVPAGPQPEIMRDQPQRSGRHRNTAA